MKQVLIAVFFALAVWLESSASACEGHYETRYVPQLVYAGHYESRWVYAPVFSCGRCVREGYFVNVYVPPQYVTRAVNIWVEDAPRVYYPQPQYAGDAYRGEDVGGSSWYLTVRGLLGRCR